MSELTIGVDLGGTKIAFALVDAAGQIVARQQQDTRPAEGEAAVIGRIAAGIAALLQHTAQPVRGIGIGTPGHVDAAAGIVRQAVNLGWDEVALQAPLEAQFGLPVRVANDVQAQLAGEARLGAARGVADVLLLAIGTGLGGAARVNGLPLAGAAHFATEVGHIPVERNGRLCACGQRGCAEMYISGKGILENVAAHRPKYPFSRLAPAPTVTTAAVLAAAEAGDGLACRALEEAREALLYVLTWCVGLLNPSLVLLGGGMARAAPHWLVQGVAARLQPRLLLPLTQELTILPAALAEPAIGAACLI